MGWNEERDSSIFLKKTSSRVFFLTQIDVLYVCVVILAVPYIENRASNQCDLYFGADFKQIFAWCQMISNIAGRM